MTPFPRIENEPLTGAELTVAHAVLKGLNNVDAAASIFRTDKCVKYHLTTIFQKCNVKSRAEFIVKYLPGTIENTFQAKVDEKQRRIEMLEFLVDDLRKELLKQSLPIGLRTT